MSVAGALTNLAATRCTFDWNDRGFVLSNSASNANLAFSLCSFQGNAGYGASFAGSDLANVSVTYCNLAGNATAEDAALGVAIPGRIASAGVVATNNWWGAVRAEDVADLVEGNATYEPFLFSPDGDVFVDDDWAGKSAGKPVFVSQTIRRSDGTSFPSLHVPIMGVTGFATLQGALGKAIPGETIYIAAGSYGKRLDRFEMNTVWTLDQPQTIIGPQTGVDPTGAPAPRRSAAAGRTVGDANEASLNGSMVVAGDVSCTVFGGLSLVGAPIWDRSEEISSSISLGDNAAAVTLYHTFLRDAVADARIGRPARRREALVTSNVGLSGLTVYQNVFTGYEIAVTLGTAASDVIIDSNVFDCCWAGIVANATAGLEITDNAIKATRGILLRGDLPSRKLLGSCIDVTLTGNSFVACLDEFDWYIKLEDGNINKVGMLNAFDNTFEGVEVKDMDSAQFADLQLDVQDRNDDATWGLLIFAEVTADDKSGNPDEMISLTATVVPGFAGLSVSFSVDGTAVGSADTDATGAATLEYEAAMAPGTYDIVASCVGATGDADLTLSGHGKVVTIAVTGPDGAGNDPVTVTAGGDAAYTAAATDAYGTPWDVTDEVAWLASPSAKGSWSDNEYTTQVAGTWNVTATLGAGYGLAKVTVVPDVAVALSITPLTKTLNTGEEVTFKATATDQYGNKWDASALPTTFDDDGADGTFAANVYTAGSVGTVSVIATLGTVDSKAATLTIEGAAAVEAGDALRYDPSTNAFLLGSTPVPSTGWYALGTSTGADIQIVVTLGTQVKAVIAQFDSDGGDHGNAVAAPTNKLVCTRTVRRGNLTKLDQVGTVGSDECIGLYTKRPVTQTYLSKNGVAAPGNVAGLQLVTHTVSVNNTIAQSYVAAP